MSRFLPILVMQVSSRLATTALDEFEAEVIDQMADFVNTKLVVYPEMHLCQALGTPEQRAQMLKDAAQPIDGPRGRRLAGLAKKLKIWLLPGTVVERGENGEIYCTAPVYSPEGVLIGRYRKCFPWRPFEPYEPGKDFLVFDIPTIGRFGVCICYDVWFPEVMRQLAWMGAEVIISMVQTSTCDRAQELIINQAQAIMNQVFVVSANASEPAGTGRSLIVDPEGIIRVESPSESPMVLTNVLNLDDVTKARKFGVCGISRPWSQFKETDTPLNLPIYNGRIDPTDWNPKQRMKWKS